MRLRRPRPESLVAWAAAAVGVIGIASALTPDMRDRLDLVRGVLPPGGIAAARVGALAFGIALVWLSRSLANRRRRAWQLAVAVVIASAIAHIAKGLDFEESVISLALFAALMRYRRSFDAPGAVTDAAHRRRWAPRPLQSARSLGVEPHGGDPLILGSSRPGSCWPSPPCTSGPSGSHAVAQTVGSGASPALVDAYGYDSLSFFALRRDKTTSSPSRNPFLAYRVVAGTALISGDPVGRRTSSMCVADEFRRVACTHGWRLQ